MSREKVKWSLSEENRERLGIKEDGGKISNFLYKFVKGVGDRVSDITYGAAGGRPPDESERREIAEERKREMEKRRAEQSKSNQQSHSQKQ